MGKKGIIAVVAIVASILLVAAVVAVLVINKDDQRRSRVVAGEEQRLFRRDSDKGRSLRRARRDSEKGLTKSCSSETGPPPQESPERGASPEVIRPTAPPHLVFTTPT